MEKISIEDVIISINPRFVDMIRCGDKRFEFRKNIFKRKVRFIFIYETQPVKKIVGYFPFEGYESGLPSNVWEICHNAAGIDHKTFFDYYSKSILAYAISINNLVMLDVPLEPKELISNFTAPQSYLYITQGSLGK